jgi:site-specific recombinase XerC
MEYVESRLVVYKERVGVDLAQTTLYKYNRTKVYLEEFLELKYKLKNILLSRVDVDFLEGFYKFLRKEKGNGNNSSVALMFCLKSILNDPLKKGIIRANPFNEMKLKQNKVPRDFLTIEEVRAIQNIDGLTEQQERNRDIYVFAIFTGLSYSDLVSLNASHIVIEQDGSKYIKKHRNKTGVLSYIPLLPVAEKILIKYSPTANCRDFLWQVISNQNRKKGRGAKKSIYASCTPHFCYHYYPF